MADLFSLTGLQHSTVVGDRVPTSALASEQRALEGSQGAYKCVLYHTQGLTCNRIVPCCAVLYIVPVLQEALWPGGHPHAAGGEGRCLCHMHCCSVGASQGERGVRLPVNVLANAPVLGLDCITTSSGTQI
jgi:hypothetical protein